MPGGRHPAVLAACCAAVLVAGILVALTRASNQSDGSGPGSELDRATPVVVNVDPLQLDPCGVLSPQEVEAAIGTSADAERGTLGDAINICSYGADSVATLVSVWVDTELLDERGFRSTTQPAGCVPTFIDARFGLPAYRLDCVLAGDSPATEVHVLVNGSQISVRAGDYRSAPRSAIAASPDGLVELSVTAIRRALSGGAAG